MGQETQWREFCRITVEFDLWRTSPNRRIAKDPKRDAGAKRAEKNALITAARWAWKLAGRPKAAGRCRYSLLIRRGKRFESDNAWSAAKALRDSLFCGLRFADDGGAITPNDGDTWLEMGELQWETGKAWGRNREQIVVIVETLA